MFCKMFMKNELNFKTFPRADIVQVIWSRNTTTATKVHVFLLVCVCLMCYFLCMSVCLNIHPRSFPRVLWWTSLRPITGNMCPHTCLNAFISCSAYPSLLDQKPCMYNSFRLKSKMPVKCQYPHKHKPPETLDIQKGNVLILL